MVVATAHNMLLNCGAAAGVSTPREAVRRPTVRVLASVRARTVRRVSARRDQHPAGPAVGQEHRVKAQFAGTVDAVCRAGHWPALVTVSFIVSAPRGGSPWI